MADGSDLVAVLLPPALPLWTTEAAIGRLRCAAATSRRVTGRRGRSAARPGPHWSRRHGAGDHHRRAAPSDPGRLRGRRLPTGDSTPPVAAARRSSVDRWVAAGRRAGARARAGQLVTAQVAAALVLVALGRPAPVVTVAALAAVLLVAAAWVPGSGAVALRVAGHRRRAPHPSAGADRAGRSGRTARPGRPGHRRPLDRADRRAGGRPGGHHRHGRAPGARRPGRSAG